MSESPYRSPVIPVAPIAWHVTWWQKMYIRLARYFEVGPYGEINTIAREQARYVRSCERWNRTVLQLGPEKRGPGHKPWPVRPMPPPRRSSE